VEARPLAEQGAAPAVGSPTVAAAAAATAKAEKAPITVRQVATDSVIDVSSVSSVVVIGPDLKTYVPAVFQGQSRTRPAAAEAPDREGVGMPVTS
jgi:hypothetical protein